MNSLYEEGERQRNNDRVYEADAGKQKDTGRAKQLVPKYVEAENLLSRINIVDCSNMTPLPSVPDSNNNILSGYKVRP